MPRSFSLNCTKTAMYTHKSLQNKSDWDTVKSTICITPNDPEWAEAYAAWQQGKPPTASQEWKLGVFLTFTKVPNENI